MNDHSEIRRPIWFSEDGDSVQVIDQRLLPHEMTILDLKTVDDAIMAISDMVVRGAPLIGVTAAYGMYLAALNAPQTGDTTEYWQSEANRLIAARPTAVNLAWAVKRLAAAVSAADDYETKIAIAKETAGIIAEKK